LLVADGPSTLVLEGGTHNPYAPPFDFVEKAFLPVINRMGPRVRATLERPGFYPAGGGKFTVEIEPAPKLTPIDLLDRGEIKARRARAVVSALPSHVAERELQVVAAKMGWDESVLSVESVKDPHGPGNILIIEIESEHVTEVFTGFGERGVSAEAVASKTVDEVREYLAGGVPVGRHLADQLFIPFAMAGGGSFSTLPLTRHSHTNIEVLRSFLSVQCVVAEEGAGRYRVTIALS
jgi:RNA 3'-terminal phosphate cyclase (ATP)